MSSGVFVQSSGSIRESSRLIGHDRYGNLTRFERWNASTSEVEAPVYAGVRYVINDANQIACIDDTSADGHCDDGETVWQYDKFGDLLSDGTNTYVYNAANRLSSITNASGTTTYTYNGDSDRISQSVNGTLTTYILDIATPLTMLLAESTGGQTTRYWHGLDTLAQSDGTSVEYFAYDGLGSMRQLVGESGAIQLTQTFDPYGNGYSKAGSVKSSFGYSGEQVDANGFVYLRARYYQPGMGRFTQMDPSRQEKNAYLYCAGNPIMFVDLTGLVPGDPTPAEGTLIHSMIKSNFLAWGDKVGRYVDVEYFVPGGKKKDLRRIELGKNLIWILPDPEDPEGALSKGKVDLIDFSENEIYEIKHIPAWPHGWAEAEWYRWNLEVSRGKKYFLGDDYLAEFGDEGTYIADWPGNPDYEVWAKLYITEVNGLPVRGVVTYWEKKKESQKEQAEHVSETIHDLSLETGSIALSLWLLDQALKGCAKLPPLKPKPAYGPFIGWPLPFMGCTPVGEDRWICPWSSQGGIPG